MCCFMRCCNISQGFLLTISVVDFDERISCGLKMLLFLAFITAGKIDKSSFVDFECSVKTSYIAFLYLFM